MAAAKVDEERIMKEGPAELERAAREAAEHTDLAWDAREASLAAAGAARLSTASSVEHGGARRAGSRGRVSRGRHLVGDRTAVKFY